MRLLAITLIFLQSFAAILQPVGKPVQVNLKDMYAKCGMEDPDITPLDFVLEHLLNLSTIVHYFEGESDEEEGEHQPAQAFEFSSQTAVTIPGPLHVCFSTQPAFGQNHVHNLHTDDLYFSAYSAEMLRPPIA